MSKHSYHRIYFTSLAAYHEEYEKLTKRAKKIYDFMAKHSDQSFTDREIKELLWFDDMNCVRPRISELVDLGWLRITEHVTDSKTNKQVRKTKAVTLSEALNKPQQQMGLL